MSANCAFIGSEFEPWIVSRRGTSAIGEALNTIVPRKPASPPALSPTVKKPIAQSAGKPNAAQIVSEMARESLTPARYNRKLAPEHLELILVRVAAGATIRSVCLEIGIASGSVYQRAIDDKGFGERLETAQRFGARAMLDMTIEVAFNDDESAERSKIKIAALDRFARVFDRNLSDRQQIDVRTVATYVLPPDADDF